jgi:hypothetical protein
LPESPAVHHLLLLPCSKGASQAESSNGAHKQSNSAASSHAGSRAGSSAGSQAGSRQKNEHDRLQGEQEVSAALQHAIMQAVPACLHSGGYCIVLFRYGSWHNDADVIHPAECLLSNIFACKRWAQPNEDPYPQPSSANTPLFCLQESDEGESEDSESSNDNRQDSQQKQQGKQADAAVVQSNVDQPQLQGTPGPGTYKIPSCFK